jgi:hypothetical protein
MLTSPDDCHAASTLAAIVNPVDTRITDVDPQAAGPADET